MFAYRREYIFFSAIVYNLVQKTEQRKVEREKNRNNKENNFCLLVGHKQIHHKELFITQHFSNNLNETI